MNLYSLMQKRTATQGPIRVGVIGAGAMGNGIAQACAVSGLDVVMVDIAESAVTRGQATIASSLDRLLKKERITAADKAAAVKRIQGTTRYEDLQRCDLIIEAATENEELKVKLLPSGKIRGLMQNDD